MAENLPPTPLSAGLLADLTLARAAADRSEAHRTDAAWLAQRLQQPDTQVIGVGQGQFPLADDAPDWRSIADWNRNEDDEFLFLGVAHGVAHFAARTVKDEQRTWGAGQWSDLRASGQRLSDADAGLLVSAVALDNWHTHHLFCPRCGAGTQPSQGGWQRLCSQCAAESYPRTDPAVIMLVVDDDDRALLGRRVDWQPEWFSTLAGFVEAGEAAEAAVRREVQEESGVTVGEVSYLGSQPWPFPWSLMLGYHARALDPTIAVDGVEIVDARWFSRAELGAACANGTIAVPPAVSIARKLIERWYGSPIPGEWEMRR
ncbi:MAG: NAD(+) diphosphatase [Candidatus Nanopelagicales bacterium]|nr:NAD(+) diphosphatase [Candidatus Nanopelagicales bacterium]MDP4824765.1 NAD(+) diphosphatase [Candidatus Nanopelagicales bacterium]